MPTSRKKEKSVSRKKTTSSRGSLPVTIPVHKTSRLSLKQEKAKMLLQQQRQELGRLIRQLENAADPEDLNKFVAFDFPVAVKRYGNQQAALLQLLDDHSHFPIKFSQLYSPIHYMNTSVCNAQTGLSELQLASTRKFGCSTYRREFS